MISEYNDTEFSVVHSEMSEYSGIQRILAEDIAVRIAKVLDNHNVDSDYWMLKCSKNRVRVENPDDEYMSYKSSRWADRELEYNSIHDAVSSELSEEIRLDILEVEIGTVNVYIDDKYWHLVAGSVDDKTGYKIREALTDGGYYGG